MRKLKYVKLVNSIALSDIAYEVMHYIAVRVGMIEVCLNETYRIACIGKHLCHHFTTQNGLR
jgi:hypothetical protein